MIQTLQALAPAYLPMALYIFLQIPVAVIGTVVVRDREMGWTAVLKSWIMGQMICFAVLQIMAVPMILARWQFNVLFWSYLGVVVVLFGIGCWKIKGRKINLSIHKVQWNWLSIILLFIIVLLVLWQSGTYFFGIHLDEDDARWLAEANDALEYGDMMWRSFFTGELIDKPYMAEDVSSPWPMMYAVASRILHIRASIFAHTIYPPLAIFTMYGIYWMIGTELLKKLDAKLTFLLCVVVLILFYGGSAYTQGAFSLVRVWQGKASVAALIIPTLLYLFICLNKKNKTPDWIAVLITACASCFMSGMGIFIAAVMIGVYGLYNIITYQNWNRMSMWIASLVPSVVSYLAHIIAKR